MAVITELDSFMKSEFTSSNYYVLSFDLILGYHTAFVFGHNPNLTTKDGLYISNDGIKLYYDDELVDSITPSVALEQSCKVVRTGNIFSFWTGDVKVYETDRLSWNTVGAWNDSLTYNAYIKAEHFELEPNVVIDITPSTSDYDGSEYGSDLHLELRDDHLNFYDYGMLPNGAVGSAKVIVNDVPINANNLQLELETRYNNSRFERLNNLTGKMQIRAYEDISTSEASKEYSRVLCSPMVVPNVQTVFTRHSEEGILYYIKDPSQTGNTSPTYMSNAYVMYKGGCYIASETGIFLFDLDNAFSPIIVGNNLVRAEFHRRSGYIKLARWDEISGEWYTANILKLLNNPQLTLVEYNDDYCEIQFGKTTWKFYRGRPFIVVNHKDDDFRILNLVDRVYCETFENDRAMGFIEEHDATCSVFNPQVSIQQFKQDLHIGQNIRTDNFELYDIDSDFNLQDPNTTSALGVIQVEDDNALLVAKASGSKLALNFPSYSSYVKRISDTFSLLIDYVDSGISSFKIKARGFDERGCVPVRDGIQYGIWEQTQDVSVDTTETDEIRVTFTNCPSDVKYLDFVIIFNDTSSSDIVMKDFMYYDGDSVINHDVDNSLVYAEQVEVLFTETYFANLYDEDSNVGLCVIRPNQHKISLRNIFASEETVFAPYMKKSAEWDKPSQIFLEYLNSKRQVIDIDWEN